MDYLRAVLGIWFAVQCTPFPALAGTDPDPLVLWHGLGDGVSRWILSGTKLSFSVQSYVEPEVALFERFPSDPWPDMVLVPSNLIALKDEFHFSEVSPSVLSGVDARVLKTVRARDGRFYGVPLATGDLIMLFRAIRTLPAKIEELAPFESANPLSIAWEQPYYFIPFLRGWGGLDEKKGRLAIEPKGLEASLRAYGGLRALDSTLRGCSPDCAFRLFLEGKSALSIADFSQIGKQAGALRPFEVDALPSYQGKKLAPWAASYALVFPNHSLNGKHSRRLLRFVGEMLSDRNQNRLYSELHKMPVTQRSIAALRIGARRGDRNLSALLGAFDASDPMPNDRAMISLWPVLRKILREYRRTETPDPTELSARALRLFSAYQKRYEEHLKEALEP